MTQTGPQHAAAWSEMRAKILQTTLRLIKETNKHVSDVKLNDTLEHPSFRPTVEMKRSYN